MQIEIDHLCNQIRAHTRSYRCVAPAGWAPNARGPLTAAYRHKSNITDRVDAAELLQLPSLSAVCWGGKRWPKMGGAPTTTMNTQKTMTRLQPRNREIDGLIDTKTKRRESWWRQVLVVEKQERGSTDFPCINTCVQLRIDPIGFHPR